MEEKQIYNLFKENYALMEGHFLLSSGMHSPVFLQCAKLLQYPDIAEKLGRLLADEFKERVDVVVAPAVGGIIIGHEVARALKARNIFAERVDGKMTFRRGFELKRGENVLAIEDVITTGGSLKEVIQLAESKGGNVVGAGAIVDRSSGQAKFDVRKEALLNLEFKIYPPESCNLCKKGAPLVYLGSRENVKR